MKIGSKIFDIQKNTYVMGILNVTPDSFSDGGNFFHKDLALKRAQQMIREGADIIDVGGESTRPGYQQITEEEEIYRTAPVLECLRAEFDIPLSLDTYKSNVAKAGISAGADLINDIWGFKYDPQMPSIVASSKVCCCLMHNREKAEYENLVKDVSDDLMGSVYLAVKAGIADDKIILDPGIGFAKTLEDNLSVIHSLEVFCRLGYPVLLGTSRKSVIGMTLNLPVTERLEGTIVTTVMAVMKGCSFVRVHDVEQNVRAVRMTKAILEG